MPEPKSRRIIISGASGLIGSRLEKFLTEQGHRVDRLVRRPPLPGSTDILWDPAAGRVEAAKLEGADAVVHLSGENIGAGRWTEARKELILKSRVESTWFLAGALARLEKRPRVLVSASAIGYYGDRGEEIILESSPPGEGFLAEVCQAWETAAEPAREAGIRVVHPRFGVVLADEGGALKAMLIPFRLGIGGPIGKGTQFISWIALSDLVRIILHLIQAESISGPVNAVAPQPVTNAEFTQTLGLVLHRPALLRVLPSIIRLLFGEMGQALFLHSARVQSSKLESSGFHFLYHDLESALRHELGA
jgi:uncharacterized protein